MKYALKKFLKFHLNFSPFDSEEFFILAVRRFVLINYNLLNKLVGIYTGQILRLAMFGEEHLWHKLGVFAFTRRLTRFLHSTKNKENK